jgi:hypothetical protein
MMVHSLGMIRLLPLLAACLLSTSAYAQTLSPYNGNEMLRYCHSEGASKLVCVSYVRAVADMIQLEARWVTQGGDKAGHTLWACIPPEVEASQLMDVAVRFITANPKDRHYPAVDLIVAAYMQAWPCSKKR